MMRLFSRVVWPWLFITAAFRLFIATVSACPATLANDGKLYITDEASLDGCNYGFLDELPSSNISLGVLGEFDCQGNCQGNVLNPNYIFWNNTANDWRATTTCPSLQNASSQIGSCQELHEQINCTISECGNGAFKCFYATTTTKEQNRILCGGNVTPPTPLLDCPDIVTGEEELDKYFANEGSTIDIQITGETETDFTVVTDYRTCQGHIRYIFNATEYCPPPVVSSMKEIEHYCTHGAVTSYDDKYFCDFYDQSNACTGIIDESLPVPVCAVPNITTCRDDDYFQTCQEIPDVDSIFYKNCGGSSFQCWDKFAQQWCQGAVVPTYATFENPVCPSSV